MKLFITVLLTIFIAEMGDKTQLLLVAMAGKYKILHILCGTWLATILLNLMAVGAGAVLNQYLDMRLIKFIAASAFFYFSYSTLRGSEEDETESISSRNLGPVLTIFISFFAGELGDKTQLSAVTLAANYTQGNSSGEIFLHAFLIFLGCTLGLILADFIGLIAGVFLKSKLPAGALNTLSFLIFAVFGAVNMRDSMQRIFGVNTVAANVSWAAICAAFIILCAVCIEKKNRQQ